MTCQVSSKGILRAAAQGPGTGGAETRRRRAGRRDLAQALHRVISRGGWEPARGSAARRPGAQARLRTPTNPRQEKAHTGIALGIQEAETAVVSGHDSAGQRPSPELRGLEAALGRHMTKRTYLMPGRRERRCAAGNELGVQGMRLCEPRFGEK